jgi:glycosyltransferase involved in cell wall biosynthesis
VRNMENIEDETAPLVSISVIAYNHENYIRQCLNSILMQNVNFSYEVLVHDDASPDRTADIIYEYETKYPGIIKPIYQTVNQYSQGKNVSRFNIDRARGKYLAFCEGDDYWTDPGKLQKQVDFLETHPEYIACVHRVQVIDEFGNLNRSSWFARYYDTSDYTLSDTQNIRAGLRCAGHLSTLICRNVFLTLPGDIYENFLNCKSTGDTKLNLLLTLNGTIRRFEDTMSVHRHITSGGTSWSAQQAKKENTCPMVSARLKELSQFAKMSYGVTLNYSDYENHIAIVSVYKYLTHPSKNNKEIMCRYLNTIDNKIELARYIIKNRNIYFYHLIRLLRDFPKYIKRSRPRTQP